MSLTPKTKGRCGPDSGLFLLQRERRSSGFTVQGVGGAAAAFVAEAAPVKEDGTGCDYGEGDDDAYDNTHDRGGVEFRGGGW